MKMVFTKFAQGRYDICVECPFYNSVKRKCTKCGCYLPAKINYPKSKCPVGKW